MTEIDNESLFLIFDQMPDPAFFHDDQFRILKANNAYFNEAGMDASQAIGKPYYEVFPKSNGPLPCCNEALHNLSCTHSHEEFTFGGKEFISYGYIRRDKDDKFLFAFHVLTNTTELKRTERILKKITSQFEILFELSPDAILLQDEQGFFDCNSATLKIFGCSDRREFIGKGPLQFSPPLQPGGEESGVLAKEKVALAFENGSTMFEWMASRLDGTTFPVEILLVAFPRDGRQVLQATVRDITARKNAEHKILETSQKLKDSLATIITSMSRTLELRDPYTAGHQSRVATIAIAIAKELGWNAERIEGLETAALLHDIGKIAIPSEILTKPVELNKFEYELIKMHSEHSYQLLKDIEFPWEVAQMVRQHHERMDGSGYPQGLIGDQILMEARVLGVADSIESMSTNRPYRFALGLEKAVEEIKKQSGIQYDEQVVNAALHLFEGKDSLEDVVNFSI